MPKHQKVWSRALAIVESGTGQTTKHESAAHIWQSLAGKKANQYVLSWKMSLRQVAAGGSSLIHHHTFSMTVHIPEHMGSLQPSNYLHLHPTWGAELQGAWRWARPWLQLSWDRQLLAVSNWAGLLPASPTASGPPRQGMGSELHGDTTEQGQHSPSGDL